MQKGKETLFKNTNKIVMKVAIKHFPKVTNKLTTKTVILFMVEHFVDNLRKNSEAEFMRVVVKQSRIDYVVQRWSQITIDQQQPFTHFTSVRFLPS